MNERYLSKAKRVDNGEWIVGYYSICLELGDNGGVGAMYRETVSELHYIVDKYGKAELIDPKTLCQCTGLKDKKGMLIFEGDAVNIDKSRENGIIMFDSERCRWNVKINGQIATMLWCFVREWKNTNRCKFEVIGNIYDKM